MSKLIADPPKTVFDVRFAAQKIAFGPMMFQAARLLRDMGILKVLEDAGKSGLLPNEVAEKTQVSEYGVRVLLEAGLSMHMVERQETGHYTLAHVGYVMLHDEMTRVNMNFTQDVCYAGFMHLEEAIRDGKPAGLKVFGEWPTVYEGLSKLPESVQKSWFEFDHYYSDGAFPEALPHVFNAKPHRLLDVGGNTGKFAIAAANHNPEVQITILDLPGQLAKAEKNLSAAGVSERVLGHPINLLDHTKPFPLGFDAVWMSQFLCCFPENDITNLLRRGAQALGPNGTLYILDTFWDKQPNPAATYCIHASSLYFTAIANGTSRMYHSDDMLQCVHDAGLKVVQSIDRLSLSHTLFKCQVAALVA